MRVHKIYEYWPELYREISHKCQYFLVDKTVRQYIDLWEGTHKKYFSYNCPPDPLPFRCCYFEIVDDGDDWGLFVFNFEEFLIVKPFIFHEKRRIRALGNWHFDKISLDITLVKDVEQAGDEPKLIFDDIRNYDHLPNEEDDLRGCMVAISQFISISNEKKVRLENKEPPLKLNKKRIKKKKVPFFSYKTLNITPDFLKNQKQPTLQPRKHKSPRFHVRRAHTRRLKSGKVVNVRSAIIGKIENGMVMKDYRLSDRGLHERYIHQY